MYQIYRQSVHQTKIANRFSRKFLHYDLPKSSQNIVLNQHTRQKRSIMFPKNIVLNLNQSFIPFKSIISEAKLKLSVKSPIDYCQISIIQILGNDDQGIALDSVSLKREVKEININLDISHAVQAWSLRPRLNKGLKLDLKGCTNLEFFKEDVDVIFSEANVRQKRSPKRHRLRRIRKPMKVMR